VDRAWAQFSILRPPITHHLSADPALPLDDNLILIILTKSMMAAHLPQPSMQVITDSACTLLEEIPKLANIPTIQGANAILDAVTALTNCLVASSVQYAPWSSDFAYCFFQDMNSFARTCNSLYQHPTDKLMSLVNATTNEEIANFPKTIAALNTFPGMSTPI
jgi:hypothetical protein